AESLTLRSFEAAEEEGMLRDKYANRALILSTIAFAISFSVWGLVGALAPKFREMYHLSAMQTSLLISVPVLLGSVGRIPMGILADKFGGRIVFGLLLCFCVIPAVGASWTGSYSALLAWGLLIGFAGTSFSVGVAFASKWFPAKYQGTALGIYGMGNIGQSVAVFGAPALVLATGDWRVPFWIYGAVAGVFGLVFLLMARNAPIKAAPRKVGEYLYILKREPSRGCSRSFTFSPSAASLRSASTCRRFSKTSSRLRRPTRERESRALCSSQRGCGRLGVGLQIDSADRRCLRWFWG